MSAQMRALWSVLLGAAVDASAASFYKHLDADGTVTYSDRPAQPGQAPISLPPSNVSTPEARRQLDLARQRWEREGREEFEARMLQWAAAQRAAPVRYSGQLSPSSPYLMYTYPTFIIPAVHTHRHESPRGSPQQHHRPHSSGR